MATILEQILTSTEEIDGVRYFNGENVLFLAAAVSDFGRDYMIPGPEDKYGEHPALKLGDALSAIYAGELKPAEEIEARLKTLKRDFADLPALVAGEFDRFEYLDPRKGEVELVFDPLGEHRDIPERYIGRLAGSHYSTLKRIYKKLAVTPGFVGEPKGRLNGWDVRFFDSQWIGSRGTGPYDGGFFLYYFLDLDGHLIAWKTGIEKPFVRDALYTLAGGSVKAHDSYPGQQPKTLLTRAKFFDHSADDIL